jgi:C4-dicarboxylate-specific signal transduction histidine kinase
VVFLGSAPGSDQLVVNVRDMADLKRVRRQLETAALNQIAAQSGAALAVMALVSIGLGWLVAGRVLRPLAAITATARRLEGSTLHERQLRAREPVDLSVAAADALEVAAREVERLGLRVSRMLGAAPVAGDRALLERLVANLVENAVRHNRPGGWVEVDTGRAGPLAVVRVANGGPPIPPDQVATLFEPFRRLEADRTGSDRGAGLGLSIVKAVAAAHGGRATARPLEDGGLEVTVELRR